MKDTIRLKDIPLDLLYPGMKLIHKTPVTAVVTGKLSSVINDEICLIIWDLGSCFYYRYAYVQNCSSNIYVPVGKCKKFKKLYESISS